MAAYSFLDVKAAIQGPAGQGFSLSDGAQADEGIVLEMIEDMNTMQMGSSTDGMHNLMGSQGGRITATYLKTSPLNAQLLAMYKFQRSLGGLGWGKNTITVSNPSLGDNHTGEQCAFKKLPTVRYGKNGGTQEWTWDVILLDMNFGQNLAGSLITSIAGS